MMKMSELGFCGLILTESRVLQRGPSILLYSETKQRRNYMLDRPDINYSYSCSRFANDDPEKVLKTFVQDSEEGYRLTKNIFANPTNYKEDIAYGPGENQKIDVWGDPTDNLFIFFHGGFWQEGNRKLCSGIAQSVTPDGITYIAAGYELATLARPLSQTVNDAIAAVEKALELHPTASKVTLGGHSAGAHLAFRVMVKVNNPRIQKLVLLAGVYELEELPFCEIGRTAGLTTDEAIKNNCRADMLDKRLQILMLSAAMDSPPLLEQSKQLHRKLKDQGYQVQYQKLDDCHHFNLVTKLFNPNSVQSGIIRKFLLM